MTSSVQSNACAAAGSNKKTSRAFVPVKDIRKYAALSALPVCLLALSGVITYLTAQYEAIYLALFLVEVFVRGYAGFSVASRMGADLLKSAVFSASVSALAEVVSSALVFILMVSGIGPLAPLFAVSGFKPDLMLGFFLNYLFAVLVIALQMAILGALCGIIGSFFAKKQTGEPG